MGLKIQRNVIVRSQILIYVENCARRSDLFANDKQVFLLPKELATDKKCFMKEAVDKVLAKKNLPKKIPTVLC